MAQRFFRIMNGEDLTFEDKVKVCLMGNSSEKKGYTHTKLILFEYTVCCIERDYMYKTVTENSQNIYFKIQLSRFLSALLRYNGP